MRLFLLTCLVFHLFLLSSCKKQRPADEAFFIQASDISVKTTGTQGSGSHKITDLWLYVNGQFKGAYPVGSAMPIVSKGKAVRVNVLAGIKNNGISDTRISWPFYNLYTLDTLVESGKTITHPFSFQYNSSTTFTWTEDFEGTKFSPSLIASDNSTATINAAPAADSFEGKSMKLSLSGNDYYAQIESLSKFALPIGSSDVYLELNYKCNTSFAIGLIGSSSEKKPVMTLNSQDSWNKIYIQLSTAISTEPISTSYKIYFSMQKDENDTETKNIFLDNIKLVYF